MEGKNPEKMEKNNVVSGGSKNLDSTKGFSYNGKGKIKEVSDGSKNSDSTKEIDSIRKGKIKEVSDGSKNSENKATTEEVPEKPKNSEGKGEDKKVPVGSDNSDSNKGKKNADQNSEIGRDKGDVSKGSKKSESRENGQKASVPSNEIKKADKNNSDSSTEEARTAPHVEPKKFMKVEKSQNQDPDWRFASLADTKGHIASIKIIVRENETVGLSDGWVNGEGKHSKERKSDVKYVLLVNEQGCPSVQPGQGGVNRESSNKDEGRPSVQPGQGGVNRESNNMDGGTSSVQPGPGELRGTAQ